MNNLLYAIFRLQMIAFNAMYSILHWLESKLDDANYGSDKHWDRYWEEK